jgi:hypothetical protein
MRIGIPANIPILFTVSACANMRRYNQMLSLEALSKDDLRDMPYKTTPEYGFRVNVERDVPGQENLTLQNVDEQFSQFSACFAITDRGKEAREYLIAVVNGTFECKYHDGRCDGEYDADYRLLIVVNKAFKRRGVLPLLKHEMAHI